ncbi:hypothetical protein [Arthrobacter crystallopoietes]|uniref:hypothetical protein n=1 Tax=Crystallibacter crystallopoietes TaxID=37928 RepID=UPI001ABE43D9|nr:hypothetical protein [Arthrobacter crystallopoietes]QTG81687.1 hypothetical protein J5251_03545 [Arthrobacter crystallopoietes]
MTTAQLATVVLGTSGAAADAVIAAARNGAHVELSSDAREEVARVGPMWTRWHSQMLAQSDTPVYGISTASPRHSGARDGSPVKPTTLPR